MYRKIKKSLGWDPKDYTHEENDRFAYLRAEEWEAFPIFLSPIFGPFLVLRYGWIATLIFIFVLEFVWKSFLVNRFINIGLSSASAVIVNIFKWPVGIGLAIWLFISSHNVLLSVSLALFPLISLLFSFMNLPFMYLEKKKHGFAGANLISLKKKILSRMGYVEKSDEG